MTFKKFDLGIQVLIIAATIIAMVIAEDGLTAIIFGSVVFYGGMAVWQLVSFFVHLAKQQGMQTARKIYGILLIPALVICLSPFFLGAGGKSMLTSTIVGMAMAVFYFTITVTEYRRLRRQEITIQ